jgi:hypothetical protein
VITVELDWLPVSEPYNEAGGALMPGLTFKRGAIARIGVVTSIRMKLWNLEGSRGLGRIHRRPDRPASPPGDHRPHPR